MTQRTLLLISCGIPLTLLLLTCSGCNRGDIEKGAVCLKLGDYAMAIVFFDKVLMHNPKHFEARVGKGKALLQRAIDNPGDTVSWREACRHLEAARTITPSEGLAELLAQVWSERARMLLVRNDTVATLEALFRSIEYDPKSPGPLNSAGIIYFRLGEFDKASTLFRKAAAMDSANPAVLFNLGMIAWNENDFPEARNFWLKGLKLAPKDEEMLYWFARAEKKVRDSGANAVPGK
jgi:Flp pilus assembly protein TadD